MIKERKPVNVENLKLKEAEAIGFAMGQKISVITDEAAEKINEMTKLYGLKVIVNIQYVEIATGKIHS